MKIFILITFILMYLVIIAKPKYKTITSGIVALICVVSLLISKDTSFSGVALSIKYDVILMLVGIMLTVGIFAESNMPNKLADKLVSKIPNALVALVSISLLSGIISAFVDNVATVLMLAPIGLAISKKIGVSPIPVLISIAVSSNLQGAATLVGDTTSIMLADALKMSFFDFFIFQGKISIFWFVELGALATVIVLIWVFRKENKKLNYISEDIKVTDITPTIILLINMLLLVCSSFISIRIKMAGLDITNGVICMACGLISLAEYTLSQKDGLIGRIKNAIDYQTVFFLIFLFIIIGCVEKVGIIADLGNIFAKVGSKNLFLLYTIIVFGSVFISAFIDNIPYVATMLPVISILSTSLPAGAGTVLYFGLLIGATLGGNITPVGASANVVAIGMLNKEGYQVKNSDFFKIGIPFTLLAVVVGYLVNWLVFGI